MSVVPPEDLRRLLAEEPFVRMLAHTLLAEEADEVVQQTWLQAVRAGGGHVVEPRSWLARIVHNVAHNLRRARQRRRRHEGGVAAAAIVPSSADLLEREERRRQLVDAVDHLPGDLRAVVLLRYFEGLPPPRIAEQLGLPVSTTWNRLRRALQLLRESLDAQHGGQRRAWLLPLIPFAVGAPGVPSLLSPPSAPWDAKAIVMPTKAKLATATVLLLAGAGITLWPALGCVNAPQLPANGTTSAPPSASFQSTVAPTDDAQRTPVASTSAAGGAAGALVVHVRRGEDKSAADDVTVVVMPVGGDRRVDSLRRRPDAGGDARFDGLPAGRFHVATDRCDGGKVVAIDGAKTIDLDYELAAGLTLTGLVVDRTGASVASASIDLAPLTNAEIDAESVAITGADGRFMVRGGPTEVFVGARAAGHASSILQFVTGRSGTTAELRLQLGGPAGSVAGTVVDDDDRPVPRAILRIGAGQACVLAAVAGVPPVPATVRTDDLGRFVAVGIAPGTVPVVARAAAKAPWRGSCEVVANDAASLRIRLGRGATIRGTVRDAADASVVQARVEVGGLLDLDHVTTVTSANGEYELSGLAAGDVRVFARHDTAGRVERVVTTKAGDVARGDLRLASDPQLRGRLVDETGAPVAKAAVECRALSGQTMWLQRTLSDAEGHFVVPGCPSGVKLTVEVRGSGIETATQLDVDPAAGPLQLQVRRATAATATVRGTVVDPAGKPLANMWVRMKNHRATNEPSRPQVTGPDGHFEFGPLAPGTWSVSMNSPNHPPVTRGPRELAANAVWDLETVPMVIGGTVRVRAEGNLDAVRFVVVDAAGKIAGSFSNLGPTPLVSGPLASGSYHLAVSAATVTADAAPFSVQTGEQALVSLQLRAGVRQQVELVADALAQLPDHVTLRVLRGADLVTAITFSFRTSKRPSRELCLVPGDYRIVVFDGDRELAATRITVAATESTPVKIELR